jgi:hypothetical protein
VRVATAGERVAAMRVAFVARARETAALGLALIRADRSIIALIYKIC